MWSVKSTKVSAVRNNRFDYFTKDLAVDTGPLYTILGRNLPTYSEVHPFRKGL